MKNNELLISSSLTINEALFILNEKSAYLTLFVIENGLILGTITDGDVRRAFLKGKNLSTSVLEIMNTQFVFFRRGKFEKDKLDYIRNYNIRIIPLLNDKNRIEKLFNFNFSKSYLPIDAVIMAGGVGSRLMPLTKDTPKPMLKIGGKPIIDYNVDLLKSYGVSHLTISVKYLANSIKNYYKDGSEKEMHISYVTENEPLGTIGAVKQIKQFHNDYILVMNSDLLTNINLEAMFNELVANSADMIIATTDYSVQIPYGVVESNGNLVTGLKEKPTYTYYSNAGIYIFKKEMVDFIPENTHFNATDLLEKGITENKKILHFPITDYWLDIGKHIDFEKAQKDVNNIKF